MGKKIFMSTADNADWQDFIKTNPDLTATVEWFTSHFFPENIFDDFMLANWAEREGWKRENDSVRCR